MSGELPKGTQRVEELLTLLADKDLYVSSSIPFDYDQRTLDSIEAALEALDSQPIGQHCPGCKDAAIKEIVVNGVCLWTIENLRDSDNDPIAIDFCPFCGEDL